MALSLRVVGDTSALERALDLVEEAISILRKYARENPEEAEKLEDILYALEEASDALDALVRAEGKRGRG